MKRIGKKMKLVVGAALVLGTLGFGAAQALGTNPDTGCPYKAGCRYGGLRNGGCCMLP